MRSHSVFGPHFDPVFPFQLHFYKYSHYLVRQNLKHAIAHTLLFKSLLHNPFVGIRDIELNIEHQIHLDLVLTKFIMFRRIFS
jgi:hypothetical protein